MSSAKTKRIPKLSPVEALAGKRLKEFGRLPILDDVVTWLRQGMGASEVARTIKQQGFFADCSLDSLKHIVARYAKNCSPVSLCVYKQSATVKKAFDKVETCLDRVERLNLLAQKQERIVNKTADQIAALMEYQERKMRRQLDAIETGEPLSAVDEVSEEEAQFERMIKSIENSAVESAGMMPGLPIGLYLVASDAYKNMLKGASECRQASKDMVEAICKIFPDGLGEVENVDRESQVGEFVADRYPGDETVFSVLTNPDSRRKVASVFNRLATNKGLQGALADFNWKDSSGGNGNNGKPIH